MNLRGHQRVGIDSNVFIYLVEDDARFGPSAGELLDAVAIGEAAGVLSTLVLTEVCSGPRFVDDPALVERVADDIRSLENTTVVPVSADVAVDAAVLRGWQQLSMTDAIHLASARSAGATAFVTNDRRVKPLPQLDVIYLDELD